MRRLTTTVCVISCSLGDMWYGMTATAVTSVCADPPSLLVCINGSAAIHDPLIQSKRFCVNLLRVGQESVSVAVVVDEVFGRGGVAFEFVSDAVHVPADEAVGHFVLESADGMD